MKEPKSALKLINIAPGILRIIRPAKAAGKNPDIPNSLPMGMQDNSSKAIEKL